MVTQAIAQDSLIGTFSSDPRARNLDPDDAVSIESQVEQADNDRPGKLRIFEAGQKAPVAVNPPEL
jgi:hypothetical protein